MSIKRRQSDYPNEIKPVINAMAGFFVASKKGSNPSEAGDCPHVN